MSSSSVRRTVLVSALFCVTGLSACSYQHHDMGHYGGAMGYGSMAGNGCSDACAPQQGYYNPPYYQAPMLPPPNLQPYTTTVTTQSSSHISTQGSAMNCPAGTTPSSDGTCLQTSEPAYTPPAYVPPVTTSVPSTGYPPAPIKPTVYYMPVKK